MKYICNFCNYETDLLFSHKKHLKTQKHIKNVTEYANNNTKNHKTFKVHSSKRQNLPRKEFKCTFCDKIFYSSSNLTRHTKTCPKKMQMESYSMNEIEKRDYEIARLIELRKHDLDLHDQLYKQQQDEIIHLKSLIKNAGAVIKTSVSALSYVAQNYNNAPILKKIEDYSYLEYADDDDTEDEFDLTQTLLNHHNDKTLVTYIGDIIVRNYKKDDPTKQSIWNSDSVRLTYVIRELIDKKPDWTVDKKGVKTIKYIIAPLLEYIRELMEHFLENNKLENYLDEHISKMKKRMDNIKLASEICFIIKNKSLSEQILKYIAPHFYLPKNDQLIIG